MPVKSLTEEDYDELFEAVLLNAENLDIDSKSRAQLRFENEALNCFQRVNLTNF